MGFHGCFCACAVFCFDGRKDGHVFAQTASHALRGLQALPTCQLQNLAQSTRYLREPVVIGQGNQRFVDGVIGRVVSRDVTLRRLVLQALVQLFQHHDIGVRCFLRSFKC